MTQIVDGKQIAEDILETLTQKVSEIKSYGHSPELAVVLVGENPASLSYIKMKQRNAEQVGIPVRLKTYAENVSEEALISDITNLNNDPVICGILIQLPLPANMDRQKVLDAVNPELDIDCLTTANKERLVSGQQPFAFPPAVQAVLAILQEYKVDLKSKKVLLIGAGDLIGRPLSEMLKQKGISFDIANRQTENLSAMSREADVIITGVGKEKLITADMIKPGAVIIDAGTTGTDEGGITGDVDRQSVEGKASLLAPVPGGVGPVTVAMLLQNFIKSANRKLKISH